MSRIVIQKSALDSLNFLNAETIEKARKGEAVGGEYIHREEIAERTTTDSKGNKRVTRYKYYYVDDMLKDSEDTILDKIMKFFYKKYPENKKKIEESYSKENIQKDYGADRKSYYQHVMEYLAHRAFWDKKFSKKEIREKYKKPIINEIAEKVDDEELEAPEEKVPVIEKKEPKEKKEKKWKPNNSLMRKIWAMNTGKTIEKEEKQQIQAKEKLNELEEHNNRSNAMLGNDNARKNGLNNSENNNEITELLHTNRTKENRKEIDKKIENIFNDVMNKLPEEKKEVIRNACSV